MSASGLSNDHGVKDGLPYGLQGMCRCCREVKRVFAVEGPGGDRYRICAQCLAAGYLAFGSDEWNEAVERNRFPRLGDRLCRSLDWTGSAGGAAVTQNAAILRHLQTRGPLTPLVALRDYGVFRLAARVKELRNKGVAIETEDVRLPNGKTIASYRLVA